MSGCAICVYDLYQDSLTAYNESVASLRIALENLKIPESEWPPEIQRSSSYSTALQQKDVSLNAFEQLERRLREKSGSLM